MELSINGEAFEDMRSDYDQAKEKIDRCGRKLVSQTND